MDAPGNCRTQSDRLPTQPDQCAMDVAFGSWQTQSLVLVITWVLNINAQSSSAWMPMIWIMETPSLFLNKNSKWSWIGWQLSFVYLRRGIHFQNISLASLEENDFFLFLWLSISVSDRIVSANYGNVCVSSPNWIQPPLNSFTNEQSLSLTVEFDSQLDHRSTHSQIDKPPPRIILHWTSKSLQSIRFFSKWVPVPNSKFILDLQQNLELIAVLFLEIQLILDFFNDRLEKSVQKHMEIAFRKYRFAAD